MQLKIAVVQFGIEPFAPDKNLARAEGFIQDASEQGAQLVVFPEDFVTGPLQGRREWADLEHRYRSRFQALAAQYRRGCNRAIQHGLLP